MSQSGPLKGSGSGGGTLSTLTGNDGVVVSPNGAHNINLDGHVVANSTHATAVFTESPSANTENIDIQVAAAIVSTNIAKVGLAAFNNADFSVDANGFVSVTNAIGGNFVLSVISGPIDFTVNALTTIYTPPISSEFVIYNTTIVLDSVTGYSAEGEWSLGITSPDYLDYTATEGFIISTAGTGNTVNNTSRNHFPIAFPSTPIIFNCSTPITATTALGRVIITGSLTTTSGSPAGSVTGPGTSVNGDIAIFNGTGGNQISDSGVTVSDIAPLTTKGDIYTFGTANARLPVGTDGYVLTANSAAPNGVDWAASGGGGGGVSFLAYLSASVPNATGNGADYHVAFDVAPIDTASAFTTGAGAVFTAPTTGKYLLSAGVTCFFK